MTDSLREKLYVALCLNMEDLSGADMAITAILAAVKEHLGNSDTVRLAIDTSVLNAYGMNAEPMKAVLLAALGDIK